MQHSIMNSTGKPSNCSKPVDNFWHSIIPSGTCHATTATTQKSYWPKWGEVADMQIGFFWFGVSMARESRNLGYIFAGITGIPQWMVFQWPEIEISLFFWENLYSTYCINHFLTNNTPAKLSYYKVPAWFNVCNCCCFPMTWKRSNTLFVRKSVFHKSSIIWPMLPPPWSHITKFQIWYM